MKKVSLYTKTIKLILDLFSVKDKLDYGWWTRPAKYNEPPSFLYRNKEIRRSETQGHPVWSVSAEKQTIEKVILYLHGGGYSKSFMKFHWKMIDELTRELPVTVIAPDYPVLPHYTADDAFSMLIPLFQKLADKYGAQNITLMGDSAGGGLAHALAQELVVIKEEQPARIILLSPWLDITLSNPLIDDIEDKDLILQRSVLRKLGEEYRGDREPTDYRVSPVYGKLRRLAPTTVFTGSDELFQPDCKKLRLKAESEPVVFNYREFNGMFHNFMFFNLPEAKQARSMIFHEIRDIPSEAEEAINAQKHFWKV